MSATPAIPMSAPLITGVDSRAGVDPYEHRPALRSVRPTVAQLAVSAQIKEITDFISTIETLDDLATLTHAINARAQYVANEFHMLPPWPRKQPRLAVAAPPKD